MTTIVRRIITVALLAWGMAATAATVRPALLDAPAPSAEQIVEKNLAARGGLSAWRKVQTMAWTGHVQGAAGSVPAMPFVLQLQRPNLTRFEVSAPAKRFTRIFDGTHGWKVRPGGNGAPEVKAFSNEEANFSRDEFVIDGPLMDHVAKGVAVRLAGVDEIDGHRAYLLEVTLPGGASRRVWVDAETFLDFRCDRPSTNPLTQGAPVSVYYRDFRSVDGLLIPHTIETRSGPAGSPTQTLTIEKIALNPPLPTQTFAQPASPMQRDKALVRVGGSAGAMH